jgi:hypothetical protein
MNREVDLAPPGEILDIAITAVFRAAGDGTSALPSDLVLEGALGAAGVNVDGLGRLGDNAVHSATGGDKLAFAPVPFGEDFGRGCAAQDARVDQAGEADVRDVPRGAEDSFKVPDCFCAAGGRGVWLNDG